MDMIEQKMEIIQLGKSENHNERNELLSKIKTAIGKVNNDLQFFACEFTYIFGFSFEMKSGKKYEYIQCIEDDRFVEYRTVTEKDGTSKLTMDYWGTYIKLVSDDGLKEILKNLETFIDGFEKGTLEQNYDIVY